MQLALTGTNCGSQTIEQSFMKNMTKRSFIIALALGVFALTTATSQAAKEKSEDELIAALSSAKEKEVFSALQAIEKQFPDSTKAHAAIKPLLADNRPKLRAKAARVLGQVHAEVSEADLKNICELFKSTEKNEIIDGLKALRGLKAKSTIPQMTPLLKHADKNVMRDACRTLAVLGDKSLIPSIKPLLEYPDVAVQKDAADAISILREK